MSGRMGEPDMHRIIALPEVRQVRTFLVMNETKTEGLRAA